MVRDVTRHRRTKHMRPLHMVNLSVIWVRDSDSIRDRVKVKVTSVVLVATRVRFRDVTMHRRTRRMRTPDTFYRYPQTPSLQWLQYLPADPDMCP